MPADGWRRRTEQVVIVYFIPFLSELKIAWAFAAVPLHFLEMTWPIWGFGTVIAAGTIARVPMNALLTWRGDWLIAPILALAAGGATCMLASPTSVAAVVIGTVCGHVTDTVQAQSSLCYRIFLDDAIAQKRGLRLQAFSATFGYSAGALLGGALYEHGGFIGCSILQVVLLGTMAMLACGLPAVHDSFRSSMQGSSSSSSHLATVTRDDGLATPTASAPAANAPAVDAPPVLALSLSATTDCLYFPATAILLCDGLNIYCYISEWSLFALYFKQASAANVPQWQLPPPRMPYTHPTPPFALCFQAGVSVVEHAHRRGADGR